MDLDADIQPGQYRSDKLKRRLEKYFGDRLEFGKSSHRKIQSGGFLVYASDIPRGRLVEFYDYTCLYRTEDQCENECYADVDTYYGTAPTTSQADVTDAFHTAACLRNSMADIPSTTWPPRPQDLENSDVVLSVPVFLFNFLAWLIVGKHGLHKSVSIC